ncbi:MAG: hypothetical protein ACRDHE_14475, partial [Ktedonobacterales bacterium]
VHAREHWRSAARGSGRRGGLHGWGGGAAMDAMAKEEQIVAIMTPQRRESNRSDLSLVSALTGLAENTLIRRVPRPIIHDAALVDQHIREGRFQRSLALIAGLSALLGGMEVTQQHYQGSYGQRVMYSPVFISPFLLLAGVWGAFNRRVARTLLPVSSLVLLGDGIIGFIFHIRGVARKPGGWRIPVVNVTMGPPIFAPLLLGIGGFLGLIATFLRREDDPGVDTAAQQAPAGRTSSRWKRFVPRGLRGETLKIEHEIREGQFQRMLAGATAVSAVLNGMESLYSHYKNNFRYRTQWTPVLLSPIIAVVGVWAIFSRRIARTALPFVSLLAALDGALGFIMHARGIARRSGGMKAPFYNFLYGPPIFAPLLFAATGFLGLLASLLRRERR